MTRTSHHALLSAVALAAFALAGCGQHSDDQTVGQKLDSAVERTSKAAHEAKDDARTAVMGAAAEAKDKMSSAADKAGNKADDARISSSVKAGLAAEKEVSAARIDVDTQDGVVTLSGNVPTAAAKARANEIAHGVKDVKSVNNQLTLAAS